MALVMRYAARSDVGSRSKNDDSAYVGQHLAVVADGMGGHAGGNIASASTVLDLIHLDHAGYDGGAGTELADEIQTANSLLSELVGTNPQLAGMGTTCTALLLDDGAIALAHIGDSRAYRLKNGIFEQISVDHTFVQRLIEEGRLRPDEAEIHPHKNVLMRVLGDVDASPELDLDTFPAEPGERWLLCSDGLNAVLRDTDVERVLREAPTLQDCADTLVELTLAGGAPDNVTVVVAEVAEVAGAAGASAGVSTGPGTGVAAKPRPAAKAEAKPPAETSRDDNGSGASGTPQVDDVLRAENIRRDLQSRPHLLIGAAALATETGQIPIVTQRTNERRAALLLTHKAAEKVTAEDEAEEERTKPVRRWVIPAFLAIMALLLVAVLGLGYIWTQTRYYVGAQDDRVAIYNGVSQTIGPFKLSHVSTVTDIPVSSLPEYSRNRLETTLPAGDLDHARDIVAELRCTARAVNVPVPLAGPSTSPSPDTASPRPPAGRSPAAGPTAPAADSSRSPGPTASGSGSATASPSPSPSETADEQRIEQQCGRN